MSIGNKYYKRTYSHYQRELTEEENASSLLAIKRIQEPYPDSSIREFRCANPLCHVECLFMACRCLPSEEEKIRCPSCRKKMKFVCWTESRVMLPVPFVNN